jgi:L-aminopeptidase/D-esterase-like protein
VITDVAGLRVGHWTDREAGTGCTVVLFPEGTVASGEVRGGAPGTREFALLDPTRLVARIDAVLLSGGSAFGLAAADGVMRWCEERGVGFPTAGGPVPIVIGAVLYDLAVGSGAIRPGPDAGYAACVSATAGAFEVGAVGAGTGATIGGWAGPESRQPGGIGSVSLREGDLVVGALFAVNAFGAIRGEGSLVDPGQVTTPPWEVEQGTGAGENTTIGVVATNATLTKGDCLLVAQSAHDGMARALEPVHTAVDGDAVVAASVGGVEAPLERVRLLAARATEQAIRAAGPS